MEDKSKAILVNTEMVRAIFARLKTHTRRPVKPQFEIASYGKPPYNYDIIEVPIINGYIWTTATNSDRTGGLAVQVYCKKRKPIKATYKKGDILWVRETHKPVSGSPNYIYRADIPEERWKDYKWSPSMHMEREACRLWLKVLGVSVEKLQNISLEGIIKEGIVINENIKLFKKMNKIYTDIDIARQWTDYYTARNGYMKLWDSIYKDPGFTWDDNPWVWRIEFEKVEGKPW